jgi:hypothetical protein
MYRISIGRSKNRKGCISGVVGVAMLSKEQAGGMINWKWDEVVCRSDTH